MRWVVEVTYKSAEFDPINHLLKEELSETLARKIKEIRQINTYYIEGNLEEEELKKLLSNFFLDPSIQVCSLSQSENSLIPKDIENKGWLIIVKPKVDVDLVGLNTLSVFEALGFDSINSITSLTKYLVIGDLKENEVEEICKRLVNEDLEEYEILKIS